MRLWDSRTGQLLRTFQGHKGSVWSVAFGDNGRILSAGADGTVRIWSTTRGTAGTGGASNNLVWQARAGGVYRAAFSPGVPARYVATAGGPEGTKAPSGTAKIWDATAGHLLATLSGHTAMVRSVALSPDGRSIAIVSADGSLSIWDAPAAAPNAGSATATERMELRPGRSDKRDRLFWVAYAPDGQSLASGTEYNTVEPWDAHTGKKRATFSYGSASSYAMRLSSIA